MEVTTVLGGGLSSNSFIISDNKNKEILVIDLGLNGRLTGFKLRKSLKEITNNKSEEYSLQVFLTHCHIDHITGSNNLNNFKEVVYSSSEKAAAHINARDEVTLLSRYMAKVSFTVDKIYKDSDFIKFGETELQVIYTPGHTDGSAVLYEKTTKSLFSGDVVFEGTCGRMDFPTGNHSEMINSLEKLTTYDIEHLYSGHGSNLHQKVNENIKYVRKMISYY